MLRSLSRSKIGSTDSLDRWVEAAGLRARSMWRKLPEDPSRTNSGEPALPIHKGAAAGNNNKFPPTPPPPNGLTGREDREGYHHPSSSLMSNSKPPGGAMVGHRKLHSSSSAAMIPEGIQSRSHSIHSSNNNNVNTNSNGRPLGPSHSGYYPGSFQNATSGARVMDMSKRPINPREKSYRELDEQERYPGLDKDNARIVLHSSNANLSQQHIYSEPTFEHSSSSHSQSNQAAKSKKFSFKFWK
jgi:hypothetical protein